MGKFFQKFPTLWYRGVELYELNKLGRVQREKSFISWRNNTYLDVRISLYVLV